MKKEIRSVDITAIDHGPRIGRHVEMGVQRAAQNADGRKFYEGVAVTANNRQITTRLRMMRCLWLQSAFLAQGGTL